ncbi:ATP-binding protein [Streptomyces sp. MUSC 125]|uniref:ATP-binding protein n=1 Tax=Streptomyces sp. MUSC 125 TaxID=1428624 RepID=UPI002D21E8D2|nr:ATP-binding protein [Streptomyces sp. MUSC 125]
MQEALTNVVRHAGTGRCRVAVGYEDEELTVEVLDEGRGATENSSTHGLGRGLRPAPCQCSGALPAAGRGPRQPPASCRGLCCLCRSAAVFSPASAQGSPSMTPRNGPDRAATDRRPRSVPPDLRNSF